MSELTKWLISWGIVLGVMGYLLLSFFFPILLLPLFIVVILLIFGLLVVSIKEFIFGDSDDMY